MLSPLAVAKREVEDEIGVEGVRDPTERRQARLVLPRSRRAIAGCETPQRLASSACDSPCSIRRAMS
jgi:hypothetical protein